MYFNFRVKRGNITENGEIEVEEGIYTVWNKDYTEVLYRGDDMILALRAYDKREEPDNK